MASIPIAKSGDRRNSRGKRIIRVLPFALVILFATIYAPLKHHVRAAAVLLELQSPAGESWFARDFAQIGANPVRTETRVIPGSTPITTRFYYPVGHDKAPTVIVLHGVHHLGIEEPRMVAFATALSSHGFLAITPELKDLADYRVTPETIRSIGECAHFVRQDSGRPATIIGLSFAGGLTLMAAAQPQWRHDIGLIVSVGGYDDLQRVLEYYATSVITGPSGKITKLPAHEYGPLVAAYDYPAEFFSPRDVPAARTTLRDLLWEDRSRAQAEAKRLTPQGEQRVELLFEHHIDVLAPVILRGIRKYHAQLAAVSPHDNLAGLQASVYLLHGAADNIVPASESEWLERDVPGHCLRMALISPVVSHLEFNSSPTLADKLNLVHFMSDFLQDAETSGAALPFGSFAGKSP